MTQTRKEALEALLEKVEAGETRVQIEDAAFRVWPDGHDHFKATNASAAFAGSLDAAKALVESTLPGWGWRMAECSVSDDAWVFPDFNCPEHGPRLRATLDESMDWCGITDVDQRPAGNPARALLRSTLIALIAQEETRND